MTLRYCFLSVALSHVTENHNTIHKADWECCPFILLNTSMLAEIELLRATVGAGNRTSYSNARRLFSKSNEIWTISTQNNSLTSNSSVPVRSSFVASSQNSSCPSEMEFYFNGETKEYIETPYLSVSCLTGYEKRDYLDPRLSDMTFLVVIVVAIVTTIAFVFFIKKCCCERNFYKV